MRVCDVTRKDCMLDKCEDCPGFENVVDFLRNEICKKWSADDTISFKQWEKVDHSELMDDELPVDELSLLRQCIVCRMAFLCYVSW